MSNSTAVAHTLRGGCPPPFFQEELFANMTTGCEFQRPMLLMNVALILCQSSQVDSAQEPRPTYIAASHVLRRIGYIPTTFRR